jgi:nicotinamidase-related amidase
LAVKFDPKKSALIVQDLQNDVIMPGGAFTSPDPAPAEHAKKQRVVANVKALAAAARAAGMPVIHVWYIVEPGAVGLKQNAPLFQAVKATKGLVRGTHGAAPVKGLEAKKGDHVVEKTRMNAFHGTNLDNLLRGLGVETVVITGAWTNFSIEHTARHAADAGYNAIVVTDGTSTIDDDWQNAALNYALVNIAERVPTAEALAVLERRAGRRAMSRKAPAGRRAPVKARSAGRRR